MVETSPPPGTRTHRRRILEALPLLVVFVGVPALILEYGRTPPFAGNAFVFIFGLWTLFMIWSFVRARRAGRGGALAFNLGVLFLALTVAEIAIDGEGKARLVRSPASSEYSERHPDLGYTPIGGVTSRFTKMAGDDMVFDVSYRIEKDGLRARPPLREPPPQGSVLLFGCSFTYGMGLEDDETVAWQLERDLEGRLRGYNFGFSGWGAHQMLANLESGRVESLVKYPPKLAVYLALADHARRVAGDAAHDRHGPRYVLDEGGRPVRRGKFSDDKTDVAKKRLLRFVHHSHLGKRLADTVMMGGGDVPLLAAITAAARDQVRAKWPDCRFVVLLWDEFPRRTDPVAKALREKDLEVLPASEILPQLHEDPASYWIHDADRHPNTKATSLIAAYLAEKVVPGEK